jgi:hypothetical protein
MGLTHKIMLNAVIQEFTTGSSILMPRRKGFAFGRRRTGSAGLVDHLST